MQDFVKRMNINQWKLDLTKKFNNILLVGHKCDEFKAPPLVPLTYVC